MPEPLYSDDLPDDCVIVTADIRVIGYLNEEGTPRFSYRISEDVLESTAIGLLEKAKHEMMHEDEEED